MPAPPLDSQIAAATVTIAQAAEYLDMKESLVLRMVGDGRLAGYVDLDEITAKLIPIRPRRQ